MTLQFYFYQTVEIHELKKYLLGQGCILGHGSLICIGKGDQAQSGIPITLSQICRGPVYVLPAMTPPQDTITAFWVSFLPSDLLSILPMQVE